MRTAVVVGNPRAASRTLDAATRVARGLAGGEPDLVALQADYALARYGSRSLSATENRRAIGRWLRIRERVRRLH